MDSAGEQEKAKRRAEREAVEQGGADPRLEVPAPADGEEGVHSYAEINGIPLPEMMAAHAEHPLLSRWHRTSISLIPDIYQLLGEANSRVAALEGALEAAQKRIAELEPAPEEEVASEEAEEEAPAPGAEG
jgi:hypothetical protein